MRRIAGDSKIIGSVEDWIGPAKQPNRVSSLLITARRSTMLVLNSTPLSSQDIPSQVQNSPGIKYFLQQLNKGDHFAHYLLALFENIDKLSSARYSQDRNALVLMYFVQRKIQEKDHFVIADDDFELLIQLDLLNDLVAHIMNLEDDFKEANSSSIFAIYAVRNALVRQFEISMSQLQNAEDLLMYLGLDDYLIPEISSHWDVLSYTIRIEDELLNKFLTSTWSLPAILERVLKKRVATIIFLAKEPDSLILLYCMFFNYVSANDIYYYRHFEYPALESKPLVTAIWVYNFTLLRDLGYSRRELRDPAWFPQPQDESQIRTIFVECLIERLQHFIDQSNGRLTWGEIWDIIPDSQLKSFAYMKMLESDTL